MLELLAYKEGRKNDMHFYIFSNSISAWSQELEIQD